MATRSVRGASSLVGDLSAIATGRVTAAVLSLVTSLISTRLLGPTGYGTVALVTIIAMLVFTVSTAWTSVSVQLYGREDVEKDGNLSRFTWGRAVIGTPLVAVSVCVVIVLKLVGALPPSITWVLVWIAVASGLMNIVIDHWGTVLETSGQMKVSAIGRVASQAVYVAGLAVMAVAGWNVSAADVLWLALGSAVLLGIAALPFVWKVGVVPFTLPDRAVLRRMLWLSAPMVGLIVSQYVFGSIDLIVLRMFRSQRDVGLYAVAYQGYSVLSAVAVTATTVLVPLFVSLKVAGKLALVRQYFHRHVPQGILLISVVCGMAVTPVPLIMPILFGHAFAEASRPMAILVGGLFFLFVSYLSAPILTLYERTRVVALINAAAAIINVVLDFLLLGVLGMGIIAPAIATSVALVFVAGAFYACAGRSLRTAGRMDILLTAPFFIALLPVLAVQGWRGMLLGLVGVAATAWLVILLRSPFSTADSELAAKLDLPAFVKRLARRAIPYLARGNQEQSRGA